MAREKSKDLNCPKCGSSAIGATKVTMPHIVKTHIKYKCLNCGAAFDQKEKEDV